MDQRTRDYINGEIAVQLEQELLDINMDILKRIERANGVIDRVTANVDGKLEKVFALEDKVDDLSTRATAPKIRELDTISSHLTQMVNALEGNNGPLLGENASTPSDGQSAENPTKPQS